MNLLMLTGAQLNLWMLTNLSNRAANSFSGKLRSVNFQQTVPLQATFSTNFESIRSRIVLKISEWQLKWSSEWFPVLNAHFQYFWQLSSPSKVPHLPIFGRKANSMYSVAEQDTKISSDFPIEKWVRLSAKYWRIKDFWRRTQPAEVSESGD